MKGAGCDCVTFLKCMFTEACVVRPFQLDHCCPQFFLHQAEERYVGWVQKLAREISEAEARPGNVVRYKIGKCFTHGALIVKSGWPNVIHAHFAARCVRRASGLNQQLGTRVLERKFSSLFSEPVLKKSIA